MRLAGAALLDLAVDVVADAGARGLVDDELVERRDLRAAARAHKVALEQVRLDALLAVHRAAARRLHRVLEQLVVDRARQRAVRRRALAHLGFGEALGLGDLLLP